MTHYDTATEETEDRFYAQYDSREVKLMTLDQLVEAFEAGEIHENTFVCREGDSEWDTLANVAGVGEEEAEPEPVLERRPPMPNRVPEGAMQTRPPMPNRGPDLGGERRPPMSNRAPDLGAERRPPMPNRRPGFDTVPASRQVSAYPSVAPAAVAPSTPLSFAPVTSNINYASFDLDDDMALRPKRRGAKIAGAMAALGIIGGAAAFVATGGLHSFVLPSMSAFESAGQKSQASLTLSNIETKPSTPAPVAPPPTTPDPAPAAAPTPTTPSSDTSTASSGSSSGQTATAGFSDDMKQALLTADKEHANKHAAKVKARATATVARHAGGGGHASKSTGFKSGGSAYDPLNGKL
jgi:hypothetical protein